MPALKLNQGQEGTLDKMAEHPGYRVVTVSKQFIENLAKSSLEYMLNRGSSNKELLKMAMDGSSVRKPADSFADDKRYLLEEGFTKEQIHDLGLNAGAARFSYDSSITNPNEFSSQLKKQKVEGYNVEGDYERLEEKVINNINWSKVGDVAGKVAIAAVYVVGAFGLGYVALGAVPNANAETTQTYWSHHGDIDGDGYTDMNDLMLIAKNWLTYEDTTYGAQRDSPDLDGDGWVNLTDFSIFAQNWMWEKPDGAVMEAYVSKYISVPGDKYHPWIGVGVRVHNISDGVPLGDYLANMLKVNSGTDNGLDLALDGNSNHKWDPAAIGHIETILDTTIVPDFIGPGENRLFRFYSIDDDPNNLIFRDREITTTSHGSGYVSVPVNVPIPEKLVVPK